MASPSPVVLTWNTEDIEKRFQAITAKVSIQAAFITKMVGGLPASEAGIMAYVQHYLKLTGSQAEEAVKRIMEEELGERPVPREEGKGELVEKKTYGVNVIRRSEEFGPWLGNWMSKANLKQAASRCDLNRRVPRTKDNLAEGARVIPWGVSLLEPTHPDRIYLRDPSGTRPAPSDFERFMGRVENRMGSVSIVHNSECVPAGTRFDFEWRFLPGQLSPEEVSDILAMAGNCGLGSAKSVGCGWWKVNTARFEDAHQKITYQARLPKPSKEVEEAIEAKKDEIAQLTQKPQTISNRPKKRG